MAFVLYKHLGSYLSTENASMKLSSETLATNYSLIVNSPVITASISKDSTKVYLSDPVIFTVKHLLVGGHRSEGTTHIEYIHLYFCCAEYRFKANEMQLCSSVDYIILYYIIY